MGNTRLEVGICQGYAKSMEAAKVPTDPYNNVVKHLHKHDQKRHLNETSLTRTPSASSITRSGQSDHLLDPVLSSASLLQSSWQASSTASMSASGSQEYYDLAAKIILLGDYNVGKTSFLRAMSRVKDEDGNVSCEEYREGEVLRIVFKNNGKKALVKLMDTGGQEKFRSLTSSYYKGAHACLLLFDVTMEESFNNIMNWYDELTTYSTNHLVTAILVGMTTPSRHRVVSLERGSKLAESMGIPYMECSPDNELMTLTIVQRLIDTLATIGLRRTSITIEIKPRGRDRKKSRIVRMNQMCLCA